MVKNELGPGVPRGPKQPGITTRPLLPDNSLDGNFVRSRRVCNVDANAIFGLVRVRTHRTWPISATACILSADHYVYSIDPSRLNEVQSTVLSHCFSSTKGQWLLVESNDSSP
jgi:hypothetical protein